MQDASKPATSLVAYAARSGLPFGLYLTLMSALYIFGIRIPALTLGMLPLILGTPVVLYLYMRRLYETAESHRSTASLWMSGILLFIFGSLVCGILSIAIIKLCVPDFIPELMRTAADALERIDADGAYSREAVILRSAVEHRMLITPSEFSITMMWGTAFNGSILSLATAVATRAICMRRTRARQADIPTR